VRFSTYAVPVIMGEMRQYLRRQRSPLHLGARLASLQREVAACEERLAARLERQPTVGEIASELNVDAEEVAAAVAARAVASLDEPLYPDDGDAVSLGDRLAGGEDWERLVENVALHAALARLSEWERRLVVLRFFEDKSQAKRPGPWAFPRRTCHARNAGFCSFFAKRSDPLRKRPRYRTKIFLKAGARRGRSAP
jgi:DNA-directed RNA polymerase specialized sigma subunit